MIVPEATVRLSRPSSSAQRARGLGAAGQPADAVPRQDYAFARGGVAPDSVLRTGQPSGGFPSWSHKGGVARSCPLPSAQAFSARRDSQPNEGSAESRAVTNTGIVVPTCEHDRFPKVKIAGRWECVVEYLDRCLGQQQVVDVVLREGTTYLAFENGHELPVLCPGCGEPVVFGSLEGARRDIRGRRLESMAQQVATMADARKCVEFSKKSLLGRRRTLGLPVEVAAQLLHPADCPYRPSSKEGARQRKGQRRP